MKYRINYTLDPDGPNETRDSFVVEAGTLEEVREIANRETAIRGARFPWSEKLA